VAEAMSSGVATALGATHAVAVTGIAGPSGGSGDKPVGTVWFALTSPDKTWSETKVFLGGRELVRSRATMHALHLLRHDLLR
jgi:PncC family amidohydrolase